MCHVGSQLPTEKEPASEKRGFAPALDFITAHFLPLSKVPYKQVKLARGALIIQLKPYLIPGPTQLYIPSYPAS